MRSTSFAADKHEPVRGICLASLHRGGMSYGSEACRRQLDEIAKLGANWVAINDFAWMRAVDEPHVRFNRDRSMEGDVAQCVKDAHAAGLKVLVKPHIWCNQFWQMGKWHGDIKMKTEAEWDTWFSEYGDYVLSNAKIAKDTGADALCVGVEYQGTSESQEKRWRALIADVRKVYDGKITYAAAFGEWPHIKWWDAVDCIGIDAYFPVASHENPDEAEIRNGWRVVYNFLEPFAKKWGKPICFLELGYSTSTRAGVEPWEYKVVGDDPALQARLYKIAAEEATKRDYVVGMFAWKWFTSDEFGRFEHREPFAIQDKPQVREALKLVWTAP